MSLFDGMLVGDVDLVMLGQAALKTPLIATQLGHQTLEQTDVYMHPETLEAQFICDLLMGLRGRGRGGMTVSDFNEKWFGGDDGARRVLAAMWDYTERQNAHETAHPSPDGR